MSCSESLYCAGERNADHNDCGKDGDNDNEWIIILVFFIMMNSITNHQPQFIIVLMAARVLLVMLGGMLVVLLANMTEMTLFLPISLSMFVITNHY